MYIGDLLYDGRINEYPAVEPVIREALRAG
jgi:hypothetical protein